MEKEYDIKFHTNAGKGIVITDKQPITGKQGIVLSFSSNKDLFDFYKKLGDFIKENYSEEVIKWDHNFMKRLEE